MIAYDTLLPLSFLKKSRFTGSERGMRYCVRKIEKEEISYLEAMVCPGPFSVDKTKPELFVKKEFPFSDEGRKAAVDWMNEEYQRQYALYEEVFVHPSRYFEAHHI